MISRYFRTPAVVGNTGLAPQIFRFAFVVNLSRKLGIIRIDISAQNSLTGGPFQRIPNKKEKLCPTPL
jgi:hypothetical protein